MNSEQKSLKARQKAEVLAYQIVQLYRESTEFRTDRRAPASEVEAPVEGFIGEDPWGHPYAYHLEVLEKGHLLVSMNSPGPSEGRQIVVHLQF